jgi:N-dimethylarginine dimethylaminohydrolase
MSTQSLDPDQACLPPTLRRPAYLMCSPKFYDVNYVINPWMAGNLHAPCFNRAVEQWHRLYQTLAEIADVSLVEPQPDSPDMVFTANAGLERDGTMVLSSFLHVERRAEEEYFRRWFNQAGHHILELPRDIPFEGEGDALFSIEGDHLWAGYGQRTSQASHPLLQRAFNVEIIPLCLVDPRFYHLDTCFAPLEEGFVMYYPEAFDRESLGRIEAFYLPEKRIPVSEKDAACFACNAINIGQTIVLNEASPELVGRLIGIGFNVLPIPLDEFLKAGGAAKCLVMKIQPMI